MSWGYHYPRAEFPHAELVAENARPVQDVAEYERWTPGSSTRTDSGPWLDKSIPSTPKSANYFASSTLCTPLIASLPGYISRMTFASFGVVRKSIHH
jgi:hypothetical protein